MHGDPCFTGTRVPVQTLLDYIEEGDTLVSFLTDFSTVTAIKPFNFLNWPRRTSSSAYALGRVRQSRRPASEHEVLTVADVEWRSLPDATLIHQARGQCDAFVTIDRGFEHEHNPKKLTFGIVIVHVPKNRMEYYRPLFPDTCRRNTLKFSQI
jgi:uncharacterized protein (DUF433 family)